MFQKMPQWVEWELGFLDWIQQNVRGPVLDALLPAISALGNAGLIWIAMGLFLLAFKKRREQGAVVLIALALCGLCGNLILKPLIARPRPFAWNPEIQLLINAPRDFSFPSGHSMSSLAAATALFLYDRKWGGAALALGGVIVFSRLYLYVHFLTDVLMGSLMGVALAFAARWIYRTVRRRMVQPIKE